MNMRWFTKTRVALIIALVSCVSITAGKVLQAGSDVLYSDSVVLPAN